MTCKGPWKVAGICVLGAWGGAMTAVMGTVVHSVGSGTRCDYEICRSVGAGTTKYETRQRKEGVMDRQADLAFIEDHPGPSRRLYTPLKGVVV